MEESPKDAKLIIGKIQQAAMAREEARKAKDLIRRKDPLGIANLPGKLADCQEKDREKCELFIVEGDLLVVQLNKLETGKHKPFFP